MSEITESEIYKLTKEQNYIRGYKDCYEDMMSVIEDIKAELQKLADDEWNQNVGNYAQGM